MRINVFPVAQVTVDPANGEFVRFTITVRDRQPGEQGMFVFARVESVIWNQRDPGLFPNHPTNQYQADWPRPNRPNDVSTLSTFYRLEFFFLFDVEYDVKAVHMKSDGSEVVICDIEEIARPTNPPPTFPIRFDLRVL